MNSCYFKSENINVFPSNLRDTNYHYNTDMFTESHITNIISDIVDYNNYISDCEEYYYDENDNVVPVISLFRDGNDCILRINRNIFVINGYQFNLTQYYEINLGDITENYYIYLRANIQNNISKINITKDLQIETINKELVGSDFYNKFDTPIFNDNNIPEEYEYLGLDIIIDNSPRSTIDDKNLLYLGKINKDRTYEPTIKSKKFVLNNKPILCSEDWSSYADQSIQTIETPFSEWLTNNLVFDDGEL